MPVEWTQSTESSSNAVCSCRGKLLETSTAENDALPCPEVRYLLSRHLHAQGTGTVTSASRSPKSECSLLQPSRQVIYSA